MPKPHPGAARGVKVKRAALGIVRYAYDFVIIHRNIEIMQLVIQETKSWLIKVGLEISEEKSSLRLTSQSFKFLGFQIAYIYNKTDMKFRVKITPSKENVLRIAEKTRTIIQNNKAASAYRLIGKLRPVLLEWANYFKFCECKVTFSKVDSIIFQQLRAWIFRRVVRQGRIKVKENYFPSGQIYTFQGRTYIANWILNGSKKSTNGNLITIYLPKISWISKEKHIKVKGNASVYDGNEVYWTLRTPRYCSYSTRFKNLLLKQKGKCNICNEIFKTEDIMEVDHIIPIFKGGKDNYSNLQLLYRRYHINKTKNDKETDKETL